MIMTTIIASHQVPRTPITITILHDDRKDARFPFTVLRETNGADFSCGPAQLTNAVTTEAEARECANESWLHYARRRDAATPAVATRPDPWDCAEPSASPAPLPTRVDPKAVPASNYALVNERGEVEFYGVDVPTRGKWKGFRFVTRLYGAPGTWREVSLRGGASLAVLARIALDAFQDETRGAVAGPLAGALRYSREFTRCAACSSPLSDPESITRGLGPVCANRF
jgi:hypothetical protein